MLAVMYSHMIKASLHVYCAMHSVSLYCLLVAFLFQWYMKKCKPHKKSVARWLIKLATWLLACEHMQRHASATHRQIDFQCYRSGAVLLTSTCVCKT